MNKYNILLKERLKSIRNVLRVFLIKYPLQSFATLTMALIGTYVFQKKLSTEFDSMYLTSDMSLIFDFYITELLFIAILISYTVSNISYKATLSYWERVKLLTYRKSTIYFFHLGIFYVISNVLIFLPMLIMLHSVKAKLYHIIYLFLIITCISFGYLALSLSVHRLLSQVSHKIKYDIINVIAIILTCTIQILIYEKLRLDFKIRYLLIILTPILFAALGVLVSKNKLLNFWSNAQESNLKFKKNKMVSLPFNNYINILSLETIRNYNIYLKFIFIQIMLVLAGKFLISMGGYEILYVNIAVLSTITIGIYNSYLDTYKLLPIKSIIHLILRGIISIILVNVIFFATLTILKNKFVIYEYLNVIFLSLCIFLIVSLIKIPLISEKNENITFYVVNYGIVTIYSIFTGLIKSIISETLNISFYEVYISGLIFVVLAAITILKIKENKNETV